MVIEYETSSKDRNIHIAKHFDHNIRINLKTNADDLPKRH
jgi:hypothetical protein